MYKILYHNQMLILKNNNNNKKKLNNLKLQILILKNQKYKIY